MPRLRRVYTAAPSIYDNFRARALSWQPVPRFRAFMPTTLTSLRTALLGLCEPQFSVVVAESVGESSAGNFRQLRLTIVGNDRPGIMREVSHALAARNISVSEMDTSITSAPMSGDPLFEATARIQVPQALDLDELNAQLDTIANALTVHIDLEQSLR